MVSLMVSNAARPFDFDIRGNAQLLGLPAVGICGSRAADEKALDLADKFGALMAKAGLVVVSGNARGVDDAAQFGALSRKGRVISVLAEGLGKWEPRARYREWINAENYAAVSEFEPNDRWQVWRAMQRNGTILDLTHAMVVVQSGESGGTWEAGLECLKRNMPLLVVQRQETPKTEGNARLISKGGIPVATTNRLVELLQTIRDGGALPANVQKPLL